MLLDVDDFVPGRDLILEMTRAGQESRCVLCVLSPDYFDGNRMVAFESLMARRLDPSGIEPRLIPLVLRSSELPEWLRGLISIDWTDPSYHAREWRKLLKALGAPNEGQPLVLRGLWRRSRSCRPPPLRNTIYTSLIAKSTC